MSTDRGGQATFVLVPGAASGPELWTPLVDVLRDRGHPALPVDIPCDDEQAGLADYVDAVVLAARDVDGPVVVVGHSFGAFAAVAACARVPARLLVLVQGMVPAPGETPGQWWENTGQTATGDGDDPMTFQHDVPDSRRRFAEQAERVQSTTPFADPWPLQAWPDVPTRFVLCTRDRFLSPDQLRKTAQERLEIAPDELESGHLPMLAVPAELGAILVQHWRSVDDG